MDDQEARAENVTITRSKEDGTFRIECGPLIASVIASALLLAGKATNTPMMTQIGLGIAGVDAVSKNPAEQ